MNPCSFETMIAEMKFKLSKSDKDIADYLIDCGSPFNQIEENTNPLKDK